MGPWFESVETAIIHRPVRRQLQPVHTSKTTIGACKALGELRKEQITQS